NNRYLSLSVTTQPSTTGYVLLDFTSAGGRLKRDITIEIPFSFYMPPNIFLLQQDELLPAPVSDRFRMIVLGDSTVGGSASPTSADAWSQAMTDALGVPDGWQSTIGGTGYNAMNPAGTGLNNLPTRMGDAINYAHDACMFAMNINDVNNANSGAANLAAIQPNFDLCYNAYRAAWPTTPLFILGVMGGTYGTVTANILAYEQAFAAYVAAKNDPNTFFIPVMSSPQPWVSGTGFVGNNTNDGNAQFYVAAATPTTAPAVASGGTGWAVNDQAVGGAVSPLDQPIQVKVTAVSGGVVTAVSVVVKGTYTQSRVANPVPMTAISPSAGTGLTLALGAYTSSEPHIGGYGYIMEGLRCADSIIDAIAKKA
ncbi:MAG: SGNH/GDSL hydrolase family protein, partial [Methylovulum sp.]|nr:SGNH/GDSL hydrolase family protein [Methylovulum sp.]